MKLKYLFYVEMEMYHNLKNTSQIKGKIRLTVAVYPPSLCSLPPPPPPFSRQNFSWMWKLLGYTDNIAEGSDTVRNLPSLIDITLNFCIRRNMEIDLTNPKIIVFRNGGFLKDNKNWYYRGQRTEVSGSLLFILPPKFLKK